ncbi:hypothetical protein BDV36DRAFT_245454 [Aspergillus pseudocaelatus]|uniref:Secreted protein n=1 Tax=Aspergillus pseudocaelatus TaxID=1825620 RepID=A0ABQ6WYU7_9EURO|nr:hypothetical protein BDV36DRAFT_245454 [Aspergillus pseudocaelatus]
MLNWLLITGFYCIGLSYSLQLKWANEPRFATTISDFPRCVGFNLNLQLRLRRCLESNMIDVFLHPSGPFSHWILYYPCKHH